MSITFRPGDNFDLDCEMNIAGGNASYVISMLGDTIVMDSQDLEVGHIPIEKLAAAALNVRQFPMQHAAVAGYKLRLARLIGYCEGAKLPLNWS